MGFFFTLLYILASYLGPETLFGTTMALYHPETWIAVITLIISLLNAAESGASRMLQTYAVLGILAAVFFSQIATGWWSQIPTVLMQFIPAGIAFYFVVLNVKTKTQLQILLALLLFAALFIIYQGYTAEASGNFDSPYLFKMDDDAKQAFYRLQGLNFINDPNDLAQFLVALTPATFIFWRKGNVFVNFLVLVAVSILCYGMFLTHSRGVMVALLGLVVFAGRKKIGLLPAAVVGIALFAGLSAAGFAGGRDVSVESGADRMDAWSTGLIMIRTHPLFGVGYRNFTDYHEITAHNTVVICAAELGLFGFFSWMMVVYPTMRNAVVTGNDPAKQKKKDPNALPPPRMGRLDAEVPVTRSPEQNAFLKAPAEQAGGRFNLHARAATLAPAAGPATASPMRGRFTIVEPINEEKGQRVDDEIRRMATCMLFSFVAFFVAGWFLSRAFTTTLFVNAGMVEVIYRMAQERKIVPPPMIFAESWKTAAMLCVGLIALVYIIIRINHFVPA